MMGGCALSREELRSYYELEGSFWWFVGRRQIVFRLLRQYFSASMGSTILDLGCGTGFNLHCLSHYGSVIGLDISQEALRFCGERTSGNFIQANGGTLPLSSSSVDLVVGLDILEHIESDEAALREIYRVCREEGGLLLTVPAFHFLWSNFDELGGHHRRYTSRLLKAKVEKVGFHIEKLSYFNTFLFPVQVVERMLRKLTKPEPWAYLQTLPHSINTLLTTILHVEALLLSKITLPVGGSLICVGRKPAIRRSPPRARFLAGTQG